MTSRRAFSATPRNSASADRHAGVAALCAILFVLAGSIANATTLQHVDTRDLTIGSSDIVIGVVESSRSYWNERHTRILTDVVVRVDRTLKGAEAGHLTLTQLGGTVDGARYSIPGCPAFKDGEEALFFVWRDRAGHAQVNGLAQGKFDIRRDPATGEATIQRAVPGFAVRDVRSLEAHSSAATAPRLRLEDLVREIQHTLAAEKSRTPDR